MGYLITCSLMLLGCIEQVLAKSDGDLNHKYIVSDRDGYVVSTEPGNNFGNRGELAAGYNTSSSASLELYIHFNLRNLPRNLISVKFIMHLINDSLIGASVNLSVCIAGNNWMETGLTWSNKPTHQPPITWIQSNQPIIDIELFDGFESVDYLGDDDELTICLVDAGEEIGYANFYSREFTGSDDELKPRLHCVHERAIPGYPVAVLLGIISIAIIIPTLKLHRGKLAPSSNQLDPSIS